MVKRYLTCTKLAKPLKLDGQDQIRGHMAKLHSVKIQQLRNLAGQPDEQANYALMLLNPRYGVEVVLSAIQWFVRTPYEEARPALLRLYQHYDERGAERDPAANLRSTILRALRNIVQLDDLPMLTKAVMTTVFPPPTFKEEGAALRSAALVALNELDETEARFQAVRLLANQHTDPMSGEPALTAVQLLAMHEEIMPLYFYVTQDGARILPEVVSECLRHLVKLPVTLLPDLLERYAIAQQDVVLVGLFDLLLRHKDGLQGGDFLRDFLQTTRRYDAYRYLVTAILSTRHPALMRDLLALASVEQQREKVLILHEAFGLFESIPEIAKVLVALRLRTGSAVPVRS